MKAIETKFVGPTNTRGAKIIASDGDGNRFTIGYHSSPGDGVDKHRQAATPTLAMGEALKSLGMNLIFEHHRSKTFGKR